MLDWVRVKAPLGEDMAAAIFRGVVKSVLHCHQVQGAGRGGRDGRGLGVIRRARTRMPLIGACR